MRLSDEGKQTPCYCDRDVLQQAMDGQFSSDPLLDDMLDRFGEADMNAFNPVPQPIPQTDGDRMDTYDARDLIRNGVQASIVLDGQTYFLRITRAGKLILTK